MRESEAAKNNEEKKTEKTNLSICDELRALHISQNIFCDMWWKKKRKTEKNEEEKKKEKQDNEKKRDEKIREKIIKERR